MGFVGESWRQGFWQRAERSGLGVFRFSGRHRLHRRGGLLCWRFIPILQLVGTKQFALGNSSAGANRYSGILALHRRPLVSKPAFTLAEPLHLGKRLPLVKVCILFSTFTFLLCNVFYSSFAGLRVPQQIAQADANTRLGFTKGGWVGGQVWACGLASPLYHPFFCNQSLFFNILKVGRCSCCCKNGFVG